MDRDNSFRHRITFSIDGSLPAGEEIGFVANAIIFKAKAKCGTMVFFGLADRDNDNTLKVRFHLSNATIEPKRDLFREGSKWSATYIACLVTFRRIYETLTSNKLSTLRKPMKYNLCQGKLALTHCVEFRPLQPYLRDLNSSQQKAIYHLVSTNEGFSVLQGPPGTGKTTTVVLLIDTLLRQGKRILVSAPSNKTVQVLAERFYKKYPFVRMALNGRESKVNDNLRSIFLQCMLGDQFRVLEKVFTECVEEVNETEGTIAFKTKTLLHELESAESITKDTRNFNEVAT
jgi:superfamily I DNA and/or RNA helicase